MKVKSSSARAKRKRPEPEALYERKTAQYISDQLTCIELQLGVETKSEMNNRDHWAVRKNRFDLQKLALQCLLATRGLMSCPMPIDADYRITFTRMATRKLDDDNLASAFKGLRDGVAAWIGIDDGSEKLSFQYGQEWSRKRGVRIRIERISQ